VRTPAGALQVAAPGGDSPSTVDATTGHGPEWGEAAPIGLLVIVLMCVAVYFLIKSMNRNLRKVPPSFEESPGDDVAVGNDIPTQGADVGPEAQPAQETDPGRSVCAPPGASPAASSPPAQSS